MTHDPGYLIAGGFVLFVAVGLFCPSVVHRARRAWREGAKR